ncbi:hypothetical protein FRC07_008608, partial [Ceratobasidium sp. 392]
MTSLNYKHHLAHALTSPIKRVANVPTASPTDVYVQYEEPYKQAPIKRQNAAAVYVLVLSSAPASSFV